MTDREESARKRRREEERSPRGGGLGRGRAPCGPPSLDVGAEGRQAGARAVGELSRWGFGSQPVTQVLEDSEKDRGERVGESWFPGTFGNAPSLPTHSSRFSVVSPVYFHAQSAGVLFVFKLGPAGLGLLLLL